MNEIIIEIEAVANPHSHLREGNVVEPLIERAIEGGVDVLGLMPNTNAGLTSAAGVADYREQLKRLVPSNKTMSFISFLMITEATMEKDIDECVAAGIVDGKIYPFMRTTKSENGVRRYGRILPVIKRCAAAGMKIHLHPEHPSMLFGNRDAEFVFLPIARMYLEETNGIIVWEHGTDARCIPHWKEMATSGRFFVTLTAHHLATNEDETFGDVRAVCKPPIKTESDRQGLVDLVVENNHWVMAGGDDAFHDESAKHVATGKCACGAYTAPFLLSLYAHALTDLLETADGVRAFVNFTSRNARRFHQLPDSSRPIRLAKGPWQVPLFYTIGPQIAVPFWAGQTINWKIVD